MYGKRTIFVSASSLRKFQLKEVKETKTGTAVCTGTEAAVMAFLGACGRLNIVPSKAELWNWGRFIVWDVWDAFVTCRDIICTRRLVVFEGSMD